MTRQSSAACEWAKEVAVEKSGFEQIEAGVEDADQHWHFGRYGVARLPAKFVLPEVKDQELALAAVGQAVEMAAGFVVARAAANHLPKLDARLHRLHEDEVHDFRDVHAGVEHIDGHGDARFVLLLEFADEAVAVGAVMHALHAVANDLQEADVLRIHLLEHVADAGGVVAGHGEDDGFAGKLAAAGRGGRVP